MKSADNEFERFDATVRKVLSVTRVEFLRREKEWKTEKERARKERNRKGKVKA